MSGRRKKMKLRTHFATQRSIKTVSELSLENAEEDALVQLLFSLDGGDKVTTESEHAKSANDVAISDETEDETALIKGATLSLEKLTLTEMKRKIIRDDRRFQLEFESSGDLSSEKTAQRLRRSMNTSTTKASSSGTVDFTQMEAEQPKATNTKVSSSLRVWFDLDKGKKQQQGKLVVIDRQISLTELLQLMRGKFNVGDQCRLVALCSLLFSPPSLPPREGLPATVPYADPDRVLECMQRALKIARAANVNLFTEMLDRYLYYYENDNPAVQVQYLSGLIALIQETYSADRSVVLPGTEAHFKNTLAYIRSRQEAAETADKFAPIQW